MLQHSEQKTEANKSSHGSETNSKSETESEEGSTASEDDVFLSIWFPSPPNFHTPYLRNRDFLDAERARKYIYNKALQPRKYQRRSLTLP